MFILYYSLHLTKLLMTALFSPMKENKLHGVIDYSHQVLVVWAFRTPKTCLFSSAFVHTRSLQNEGKLEGFAA